MMHIDLQIVEKTCAWLQQQHEVVLFTVIQTWGSSPRPVGSMLAICDTGSRTPAEIAIAILADITARRHDKHLITAS